MIVVPFFLFSRNNQPSTKPQQTSPSVLQKTTINETTEEQVAKLPNVTKTPLENGSQQYTYPSDFRLWNNEIVTKNGKAVLERIVIPDNPAAPGHETLSEFLRRFGDPDRTIEGETKYSRASRVYIYGSQGMAAIGNPHSDVLYEIQKFSPMSDQEYLNQFGSEINQNPEPHQEKRL